MGNIENSLGFRIFEARKEAEKIVREAYIKFGEEIKEFELRAYLIQREIYKGVRI